MPKQGQEPDPLVTECPHCDTRFRVTENQLILAEGRVRCGACLAVFSGADYLQLKSDIATSEEAARTLDEVLSELDEGELEDVVDEGEVDLPADLNADDRLSRQLDDESEKTLLSDDEYFSVDNIQDTQDFPIVDTDSTELIQDTQEVGVVAELQNQVPEDFDEQGDEAEHNREAEDYVDAPVSLTPFTIVEPAGEHQVIEHQVVDQDTDTTVEPAAVSAAKKSVETEPDKADYEELPEYLRYVEKPRSRWVPVLFLFGLAAITAQIFYFQFDTWGKDQKLRPLYAFVCEQIGCQLPVIRSLGAIRTRSLSVRSHDSLPDVLSVEALFVNEAGFAQPFPTLELNFTSMRGLLITSYRYEPEDYLEGELKGVADMEPLQPVRIALEVPDPGAEAVNYFMKFL